MLRSEENCLEIFFGLEVFTSTGLPSKLMLYNEAKYHSSPIYLKRNIISASSTIKPCFREFISRGGEHNVQGIFCRN